MKVLVTTHAQMFEAPDGSVWTDSVYGYGFFKRYLDVFDSIRLVTRIKEISKKEIKGKIRVDGKYIEIFKLPFYHGPWEYAMKYRRIDNLLEKSIDGCDSAILRIPDQKAFQLFKKIRSKKIPCGVEVVAHSWDLFAPGNINTILRPILRIIWDMNQKYVCSNSDGVAYVTKEYLQKRYPSKIIDNNRVETNYTSADLDDDFFFRPRTKEDLSKNTIRFIHVSGISNTAKGHKEILYTLKKLKDLNVSFNMTFIGGGTLLNYFRDLASELDLSENVSFYGNISSYKEIIEQLKKADIFLFPSLTEGLPRVLIEAMATGLPCIASKVGGIPELIDEEFLVDPCNVDDILSKILRLTSDIEIMESQSEINYKKIEMEYSKRTVQLKRNNFYEKIKFLAERLE